MEVSSKTLENTTKNLSAIPQISSEGNNIEKTKVDGGGNENFTILAQEPESLTILQKKFRRAERFGMPVLLSEEEKRMNRAERFGTGPSSQRKSEEQKRKDRAKRFGITVKSANDEEEKKKARLARFGEVSKLSSAEEEKREVSKLSSAEEEKRNARALRFSQSGASTLHPTSMSKQA